MKYTEKELIRLKNLKETAKKEYRVFISSEEANPGTNQHARRVLKDKKNYPERIIILIRKNIRNILRLKNQLGSSKKN